MLNVQVLSGPSAYFCSSCDSKQTAQQTSAISKAPLYLVVTFNRFSFGQGSDCVSKRFDNVSLEPDLRVPLHQANDAKYGLYAVVIHQGDSGLYR